MNRVEVENKIGKKYIKAFDNFMKGQTVGINKNGSIDYYDIDVNTFIQGHKNND